MNKIVQRFTKNQPIESEDFHKFEKHVLRSKERDKLKPPPPSPEKVRKKRK